MQYTHNTKGKTCTTTITVDLDNENRISDIIFSGGGCKGNLIALRGILLGKHANWVINQLKGIPCGNKGTSCANELALCLEKMLESDKDLDVTQCYFYTGESLGFSKHECYYSGNSCEDTTDCPYKTDKEKYENLVTKLTDKNNKQSVL